MFGRDVSGDQVLRKGTNPALHDVCKANARSPCRGGLPGGDAGELFYPESVAVDSRTGAVYVVEASAGGDRLDKYTSTGELLWIVGKGVNRATGGNVCTERDIRLRATDCRRATAGSNTTVEPGEFKFAPRSGDLLAVGGPNNLVYVGDEHRIQEFDASGRWTGEILLVSASSAPFSAVTSLAVDRLGDLYAVYKVNEQGTTTQTEHANVIRSFNPSGEQISQFAVPLRLPDTETHIDGIAIDSAHRLAVIGVETGTGFYKRFGFIYHGANGYVTGEFDPPPDNDGLAFGPNGSLYVAATDDQQVVAYDPSLPAQLVASPVSCVSGYRLQQPTLDLCGPPAK